MRARWRLAHDGLRQAQPVVFVESNEVLKRLIDEEYTRHPFYGSRKMVV